MRLGMIFTSSPRKGGIFPRTLNNQSTNELQQRAVLYTPTVPSDESPTKL